MLGRMHPTRRSALLAGLALLWPGCGAWAGEPRQNFWVELRWTESSISGAAVAALRDGALLAGTAGSTSPRGAVVLSTEARHDDEPRVQRLTVLNGYRASVQLGELVPVQWVDVGVGVGASGPTGGGRTGSGATAGPGGPGQAGARAWLRQGYVEQVRGFALELHWPGGQEPVRIQVQAQDVAPSGSAQQPAARREVLSTLLAPLGEWVTVARSGGALAPVEKGVYRSRDAEAVTSRELQLRVQRAP